MGRDAPGSEAGSDDADVPWRSLEQHQAAAAVAMAEGITDMVVVLDDTGAVVWANRFAGELLGYRLDEATTLTMFDVLHPDEVDGAVNVLARTLDPSRSVSVRPARYRFRHHDGSYRTVWANGIAATDQGLIVLHAMSLDDVEIFDRVMAEVAAGDVDAALGAVPDFGTTRLPGEHFAVATVEQDRSVTVHGSRGLAAIATDDEALRQLRALGESWSGPVTDLDGALHAACASLGLRHLTVHGLVDPLDEQPCTLVAGLVDDTEALATRYVLQRMASATRLVLQSRNLDVRRRRAAHELQAFLADASHELRTPLTNIVGYADLAEAGLTGEALTTALGRIRAESERVIALVEDLLLLARLGERPRGRRDAVDLAAVVDEVIGDLAVLHPDRLVRGPSSGPVLAEGDEDRLRQVVTNLVVNAVRHTPPGTEVGVELVERGAEVRLDVVDDGPGLAADDLVRVFDRFWRAARAAHGVDGERGPAGEGDRPTGTGLGLAITRGLVESMGGRIRAESRPGAGARFVVELRAADASDPTRATP